MHSVKRLSHLQKEQHNIQMIHIDHKFLFMMHYFSMLQSHIKGTSAACVRLWSDMTKIRNIKMHLHIINIIVGFIAIIIIIISYKSAKELIIIS